MAETNIKIVIEYDGTDYAGWQVQDGQPTIQGELVTAIKKTTGIEVNLIGAGRTDAGVHALGQVANFRIDHRLEPERYRDALNYYLQDDIRVKSSEAVDIDFHSRFGASARHYRYVVSPERSAINRNLRLHYPHKIDLSLLKEAGEAVLGTHDFAPFCVVASRKENNECQVVFSKWRQIGPLLVYEVRANRFLHSMVRSLVGAMLNLASVEQDHNRLNLTLDSFTNIINVTTEQRVAFTAPAHGLYLVRVAY